ncbi:class E sortase [Actinomyces sp. HMSC065F11]|uniref:class E sortase n=1 Tax=Actinomyces sp. HMSC065F11 TaxID=1739395 RepID=UPI0008A26A6C|nr:class E sortase [Actinomyces sp. HMSC065F11]OFR33320.1 sortase [Actinomyces sp. HMSC065F11]
MTTSSYPSRRAVARKKPSLFIRFIGVLGELMITASLVIGLFIFWQLYWTSWEVEADREQAISDFEAKLPRVSVDKVPPAHTEAPPEFTPVGYGETMGILHIPVWDNMKVPVVHGTAQYLLDQALGGHYEFTQWPGEVGNFAVAAHRRSYGNNFRYVDTLEEGTPVVMETSNAFLVYKVVQKEIVLPEQTEVINPVPDQPIGATPTKRMLTMTTCSTETGGQFGNSHRYIVHLEFQHWYERDEGMPPELKSEKEGA